MARKIEITIDELILRGFTGIDRAAVGKALEQELARLLTRKDSASLLSENMEAGRIHGGTIRLSPGAKASSIGKETAQSVFKGLTS